MSGDLVNPNLHVVLIHLPLGVFVAGMGVELFSFLYRRSSVRTAARWMILLGALSMIPTAFSGVYAFADVAHRAMPAAPGAGEAPSSPRLDRPWRTVTRTADLYDGKASEADVQGEQYRLLERHVWLQGSATALVVLAVLVGLASPDRWRQKLYLPLMGLLLLGLGVMLWGAWAGGETVYRYGTGVTRTGGGGHLAPVSTGSGQPPAPNAAGHWTHAPSRWKVQGHVILAGLATAAALAALALSVRAAGRGQRLEGEAEADLLTDPAWDEPGRRPASRQDMDLFRSFQPQAALYDAPQKVPAGRFWVLTLLLLLLTAIAGVWFLVSATDARARAKHERRSTVVVLWEQVTHSPTAPGTRAAGAPGARGPDDPGWLTRRLAHVIGGTVTVVLTVVLAGLARWARQRRVLLAICSLLLVAAVGAQLWLGILLMYDTPAGPIHRFQQPESEVLAKR